MTVAVCEVSVGDNGSLSKMVFVTVAVSHRRNKSVEADVGDSGSLSKVVLVTVAACRSWGW